MKPRTHVGEASSSDKPAAPDIQVGTIYDFEIFVGEARFVPASVPIVMVAFSHHNKTKLSKPKNAVGEEIRSVSIEERFSVSSSLLNEDGTYAEVRLALKNFRGKRGKRTFAFTRLKLIDFVTEARMHQLLTLQLVNEVGDKAPTLSVVVDSKAHQSPFRKHRPDHPAVPVMSHQSETDVVSKLRRECAELSNALELSLQAVSSHDASALSKAMQLQIRRMTDKVATVEAERDVLRRALDEHASHEEEFEALQHRLEEAEQRLASREAGTEADDLRRQLLEARREIELRDQTIIELMGSVEDARKSGEAAAVAEERTTTANVREGIREILKEVATVVGEKEGLERRLEEAKRTLFEKDASIEELKRSVVEQHQTVVELEQALEDLKTAKSSRLHIATLEVGAPVTRAETIEEVAEHAPHKSPERSHFAAHAVSTRAPDSFQANKDDHGDHGETSSSEAASPREHHHNDHHDDHSSKGRSGTPPLTTFHAGVADPEHNPFDDFDDPFVPVVPAKPPTPTPVAMTVHAEAHTENPFGDTEDDPFGFGAPVPVAGGEDDGNSFEETTEHDPHAAVAPTEHKHHAEEDNPFGEDEENLFEETAQQVHHAAVAPVEHKHHAEEDNPFGEEDPFGNPAADDDKSSYGEAPLQELEDPSNPFAPSPPTKVVATEEDKDFGFFALNHPATLSKKDSTEVAHEKNPFDDSDDFGGPAAALTSRTAEEEADPFGDADEFGKAAGFKQIEADQNPFGDDEFGKPEEEHNNNQSPRPAADAPKHKTPFDEEDDGNPFADDQPNQAALVKVQSFEEHQSGDEHEEIEIVVDHHKHAFGEDGEGSTALDETESVTTFDGHSQAHGSEDGRSRSHSISVSLPTVEDLVQQLVRTRTDLAETMNSKQALEVEVLELRKKVVSVTDELVKAKIKLAELSLKDKKTRRSVHQVSLMQGQV